MLLVFLLSHLRCTDPRISNLLKWIHEYQIYHIYLNVRQVFSLNLVLNMWGCLKFTYDALSHTAPNRTTAASPNCHVRSPIFWDILHSLSGNSLPMYWENLLVPSPGVKTSKREKREQLKLTEKKIFFLWDLPITEFF